MKELESSMSSITLRIEPVHFDKISFLHFSLNFYQTVDCTYRYRIFILVQLYIHIRDIAKKSIIKQEIILSSALVNNGEVIYRYIFCISERINIL